MGGVTEPAHTGSPTGPPADRALVHLLLSTLARTGVPLRPGDLEQLHHAATGGPVFVHALTSWIRAAHTAASEPPQDLLVLAPLPTADQTPAHHPGRQAS